MWTPFTRNVGHHTPQEVKDKTADKRLTWRIEKLGEQAIKIDWSRYLWKLIKGHTEKHKAVLRQTFPPHLISSVFQFIWPLINNYFNDRYQGIPIGGYNSSLKTCWVMWKYLSWLLTIVKNWSIRRKSSLRLTSTLTTNMGSWVSQSSIWTRNLGWGNWSRECCETTINEREILTLDHWAQALWVWYTNRRTVTTWIPSWLETGDETYYPINDERTTLCFGKFKKEPLNDIAFRAPSRLYYDMHVVIERALEVANEFD